MCRGKRNHGRHKQRGSNLLGNLEGWLKRKFPQKGKGKRRRVNKQRGSKYGKRTWGPNPKQFLIQQ